MVLASIVGERGSAGQTAYAATKAAVATIARSSAKELVRHGIRVNAVAPGLVATDMTAHLPRGRRWTAASRTRRWAGWARRATWPR